MSPGFLPISGRNLLEQQKTPRAAFKGEVGVPAAPFLHGRHTALLSGLTQARPCMPPAQEGDNPNLSRRASSPQGGGGLGGRRLAQVTQLINAVLSPPPTWLLLQSLGSCLSIPAPLLGAAATLLYPHHLPKEETHRLLGVPTPTQYRILDLPSQKKGKALRPTSSKSPAGARRRGWGDIWPAGHVRPTWSGQAKATAGRHQNSIHPRRADV